MHRCLGCMREYKDEYQVCPYCGYEVGTPPKEAYHMVPGTLLTGRYTVGQVLGFGGFGVTYIGYDNVLERKVAIKEYLPSEFSTRIPGQTEVTTYAGERTEQFNSGLTKFLDEAKTLAKLQSANGVVQIYNSFQENNTAYIVMEYLEGKTLKTYLEETEKIPVEEAKEILHPIITALKEVHALGIIHRDIAPDNIFLTNDGRVKLLDFGASRFATTSHSKSLSVIIKQGYAPVEQYRSRGDQGPWTDVYSLSATLYKMITGITPEDAMERIEKEELKKPSKLGIDIPKNTENAIMNALNIKIEDRTQDIEAFEKELYHDENVKLKTVHLKKADVGRWPLWAKLTVSGASVAVATFAVLLITGVISFSRIEIPEFLIPDGKTRVPNVVNEEVDYAQTTLKDAELYFQIVDKQYSEYIPQDMVLTQSINRGKIVDVNGVVEVVVSGGLEHIFMVDVYGYNKDEAIKILNALGLTVDIVEDYGDLDPGAVLEQSIAAGEETYRGAKVVLTVSKGYDSYIDKSQTVEVPDFTGMTLKEAQAAAKKCGLYIVKTGSKKGQMKAGCILEQTPKGGSDAHQGDTIEVITVEEEIEVYMPDVQYKDEVEAVAQLEALGLTVKVSYEKSSKVAQGKVISQSIEPYTKVKNGEKVSLVVSLGDDEINKVMAQWSDWMVELPAGVNKDQYEIETKTQYSFRDKSTTTSSESSLPGWTYYDTVITKGEFGDWSEWSTQKPEQIANREIDTPKEEYKYSHKENAPTKQTDNNVMSGWVCDDSLTKTTYDDWSDWSYPSQTVDTTSDTNVKEVKTLNWYSYRTKSTTSVVQYENATCPAAPSGYPNYENVVKELDASRRSESGWVESNPGASDTAAGKTEIIAQENRTRTVTDYNNYVYYYYRWEIWLGKIVYFSFDKKNCEAFYRNSTGKSGTASKAYYSSYPTSTALKIIDYDGADHPRYEGDWYLERTDYATKNENYSVWKTAYTPYKYTFTFSNLSAWSNPVETLPGTYYDKKDVTMYSSRTRNRHYIYSFYRWVDEVTFSADKQTENSNCKLIAQRTLYRYRDKKDVYTYYFYQWGDWSGWRDEKIEKSDSREVQARTMYRYKLKQ